MKKIVLAGIGALALACGGSDTSIEYGSPEAPTLDEQYAIESAQTSLSATVAYDQATEPALGAPGLADQLAMQLGAYGGTAVASADPVRSLASRALGRAPSTALEVGMDPACVHQDVPGRIDWVGCEIVVSDYDPVTGDTLDMTINIDGFVSWNVETGVTTWDVVQVADLAMTMDGETILMDAVQNPSGTVTVTASTIDGHAESTLDETIRYMGQTIHAGVRTTLDLDLDYQIFEVEPRFRICGGTLQLEQVWTRRPSGYGEAQLPNLGWIFEWTGCGEGQFTVTHGS